MARLYADENFPLPAVQALRASGHDIVTLQETGQGGRAFTDEEVLSAAATEDRAVLTMDRKHFIALHARRPEHRGIIVCTFDPDFIALGRRIDEAVGAEPKLPGKLMRVRRPQR